MLPVPDRTRITVIDLDPIEQGRGTRTLQPAVQPPTEATEVSIGPVAQRQQAVGQARQIGGRFHRLTHEAGQGVRGVPLAGRGGHDQDTPGGLQLCRLKVAQKRHAGRGSGVGQAARRHPGQFLGQAGLAGEGDQHGGSVSGRCEGGGSGGGGAAGAGPRPPHEGDRQPPEADSQGPPEHAAGHGGPAPAGN